MKKLLLLAIITCGFGQVTWEIEKIDTVPYWDYEYFFSSLTLNADGDPCVVYNKACYGMVEFAMKVGSLWQKEMIDTGCFYHGLSLIADDENTLHLSYCRRNTVVNTTYLCYGRRDASGWQIELVDGMYGSLGNYWRLFNTSIDLDTAGLPGIAYIAWNLQDSIHYIKFAHYNGIGWDTSIVEYDSAYANMQAAPTDYNPSLRFNSKTQPYVAFYHACGTTHGDTLKLAHYDDTASQWIVEPVLPELDAGIPVSLDLTSQDYPCIAHGYGPSLAYTWWDGSMWHTDYGIESIGWLELRIVLALDNNDRPHIIFRHWGTRYPRYCYKDSIWHLCGSVEVDSFDRDVEGDLSLIFDDNNQPHIGYKAMEGEDTVFVTIMKHAKGTITGVEEGSFEGMITGTCINIVPNPFRDKAVITLNTADQNNSESTGGVSESRDTEIQIYDISGRLVKTLLLPTTYSLLPTIIWDGTDGNGQPLSSGVYFVHVKTQKGSIMGKVVMLE